MREVNITKQMLKIANEISDEMGVLKGSFTKGEGNVAGALGELIALQVYGGVKQNTYNFDILLPNGDRLDVKTKRTIVVPLPSYSCSVSANQLWQQCDQYAFVRVKKDLTMGWALGKISKLDFLHKATFMEKGMVDKSNNFKVKVSCYNLPISALS
jgi:hypothetical protein